MENTVTEPILSICIPTFNRAEVLRDTLESIVVSPVFLETNKVEVRISDNGSTDSTREVVTPFLEQFPGKIYYIFQENPVSGDENFILVLNQGRGRYLKLHNDKFLFKKGVLKEIVSFLESGETGNILFFPNEYKSNMQRVVHFSDFEKILFYLSYRATWIGGLCILRAAYEKNPNPGRYSHLSFGQVDLMAEALKEEGFCTVRNEVFFALSEHYKETRTYSLANVFGTHLNELLGIFVQNGQISPKTRTYVMWQMIPHINRWFSWEYVWTLERIVDYWENMFPIYGRQPLFYLYFLKMLLGHPINVMKRGRVYQSYRKFRLKWKSLLRKKYDYYFRQFF